MILFRCNAGPKIGFGHLTRCRALAYALREQGESCIMVGPDHVYTNKDDADLFDTWIPQKWRGAEKDALSLAMLANEYDANKLVLDDYRVNEEYQLVLRNKGLKWLQFEARTSHPIWADIVLNASPAAKEEDYAAVLSNPDTSLLIGPKYAVLRAEFINVTPRNPTWPIKQVLVTFGAGDDRGAIQFILSTLLPISNVTLKFLVISGTNNPRNLKNLKWIEKNGCGRVRYIINPEFIGHKIKECDLAIISGGTTYYEAACCGVPMILLATAKNQLMKSTDAAIVLGQFEELVADEVVALFKMLLQSFDKYIYMSKSCVQTVDGRGAIRVAQRLIVLPE